MPNLYLIWFGAVEDHYDLFGISCSSALPALNYPQVHFENWASTLCTKPALAALPDRILLAFNSSWNYGGLFPQKNSGIDSGYCQSWPSLPGRQSVPGIATSWSPAVTAWGPGAIMVWPGLGSDTRIWTSIYHSAQNTWTTQYLTQLPTGLPIQAGSTPAIVNFNGTLLMVWRGEGSNANLYYATSSDGIHWQGNRGIPGGGSSIGPAMVVFNGSPVLCFKGSGSDDSIYSTTYHAATDSWAPVARTGPFGTSHGPSIAVYRGELFMTWKGLGNDTGIYWAITPDNLNPLAWSGQSVVSNVGTCVGPAVAVY